MAEEKGQRRLSFYSTVLLYISVFLSGCSTIHVSIDAPPAAQPSSGHKLLAGASKVDITPPPGYPMGGHGPAGKIGRGTWLRLYARSIFLEDPDGTRIAMVSADLWAMHAGLVDRVAEIISQHKDKDLKDHPECVIGSSGLIIAATHTHQSPANFASSPGYNTFASPLQGFDRDLFEFLAQRISKSIEEACMRKTEARIYLTETTIPKDKTPFARNRSFEAFSADPEAVSIIKENEQLNLPEAEVTEEYPINSSYRAVNPYLRVMRIREAASQKDIALAAFAAVHNTSMSHDAEVYSSDLFGAASLTLEREVPLRDGVAAIFNGAEGDISPYWTAQDRRDTLRLGRQLADGIRGLPIEGKPLCEEHQAGCLNYRTELTPIGCQCFPCEDNQWNDSFPCPKDRRVCTARDPLAGVGLLGGAEDGRTFLYYLGCREGVRKEANYTAQGNKEPMLTCFPTALATIGNGLGGREAPVSNNAFSHELSALTQLVIDLEKMPREVPIGIYSVGPAAFVSLPGEFTTVMGKRITDKVKALMHPKPEYVVPIGLANEYLSYFATPEEYQLQAYEGASTLYGVMAGEFVGHTLGELAKGWNNDPPVPDQKIRRSYDTGPANRFGIASFEKTTAFPGSGFSPLLRDLESGSIDLDRLPAFCWSDQNMPMPRSGQRDFTAVPQVKIIRKGLMPEETIDDDQGLNFVTFVASHEEGSVSWCSLWLSPHDLTQGAPFIFKVETLTGQELESPECMISADGKVNKGCRVKGGEREKMDREDLLKKAAEEGFHDCKTGENKKK